MYRKKDADWYMRQTYQEFKITWVATCLIVYSISGFLFNLIHVNLATNVYQFTNKNQRYIIHKKNNVGFGSPCLWALLEYEISYHIFFLKIYSHESGFWE